MNFWKEWLDKKRMAPRTTLWIIILAVSISIFINADKSSFNIPFLNNFDFPLKLGLDLQGGTQLILQTKMDNIEKGDRDNALESARNIIERRVNFYGLSEAIVQLSKIGEERRIIVELPGLKNATEASSLVGQTALLEFREIKDDIPPDATGSATFNALLTAQPTGLTGADLKRAQVVYGGNNSSGPVVQLEFTMEGSKKFAEITKRNIGKILPIFLDGEPITWPTVNQEIVSGPAIIEGQFTTSEAKNLSIQLNAGALPVPIQILEQRSIGPTLGKESVEKSLIAGILGLLIVILYMGFYYGRLGIVADCALIIYALIVLAIFKTGLFIVPPITLTLAGIAGFVLSIGMAVDANILIFERMKEEIRWGRDQKMALELGFKRAWSSIWASNVSSLMTAAILYGMGSTLIKGFAITLVIGVLVSMFTAIVVTRTFLRLIIK